MTRDFDILLSMILAVALSLGVRRLLSTESIYTLKLTRRRQVMPRSLHANLFLVRSAREVMLSDVAILDAAVTFSKFLAVADKAGGLRHVIVMRGSRFVGVLRVNMDLRRAIIAAGPEVSLGALASRQFTVVREDAAAFDVIARMRRKKAVMAVVISRAGSPESNRILGVITCEQIADSVADSIGLYVG